MFNDNLPLVAGATFDFELTWETKDETNVLKPVKLMGCTVEFEVRKSGDDTLLVRCTTEDGNITVPEPETGQVFIHIPPDKTANQLPENWRDAIWEVVVTFPSLDKYSIAWGSASLRRKVVHSNV